MLVRFVVRLQAGLEHWHALSPVFRFRLVLCLIAGGLAAWVIFDADRPWTMNLLQTADERGKPLYIMVPHPWAAFKVPELWRLFNESGLFADFVYFRGLDQTNDRVVARYEPGSAYDFSLEAFLRGREAVPNPNSPPPEFPSRPVIYPPAPQAHSAPPVVMSEVTFGRITWSDDLHLWIALDAFKSLKRGVICV